MTEIHTGTFVTATVTPPDPKLEENRLAELAREMAWNIQPVPDTLATFGISQEQFDHWVLPNAFYKRVFEIYVIEWQSANSTNKRLAIKSAYALESKLPDITARMGDKRENLTGVIEAAKLCAKIAGAGEQKPEAALGEKFTINISLGAQQLRYEETIGGPQTIPGQVQEIREAKISGSPIQHVIEGPRVPTTVQKITETHCEDTTLFQVPEGD